MTRQYIRDGWRERRELRGILRDIQQCTDKGSGGVCLQSLWARLVRRHSRMVRLSREDATKGQK